jgi:hypothetical protein
MSKQKDRQGFAYHRLRSKGTSMTRADHLKIAADSVRVFDDYPNVTT